MESVKSKISEEDKESKQLDAFLDQVHTIKKLCPEAYRRDRLEADIPLKYEFGKYIKVTNILAYSKHINRGIKSIGRYFATKIGASYEADEETLTLKVNKIDLETLVEIQKEYCDKVIRCVRCRSPDTIEEDLSKAYCLACKRSYNYV